HRKRRTSRRPRHAGAWGSRPTASERSKVRRRAALFFAAGDEGGQRLEALGLERRRDEIAQAVGDDALGRVDRGRRAGFAPSLIIAPVRDGWWKKGGAVARLRVLGAEEMPAGADFPH